MKRKVFAVIMAAVILMGVVASANTGSSQFLLNEIGDMKTKVSGYLHFFADHADELTDAEIETWAGLVRLYFELNNTFLVISAEYFGTDPTQYDFDLGSQIKTTMTQFRNGEKTRQEVVLVLRAVSSTAS